MNKTNAVLKARVEVTFFEFEVECDYLNFQILKLFWYLYCVSHASM